MTTTQFLAYAAISVFCALKVNSLDTFIAAVYEHAVRLPDDPLTLVSPEEALAFMNRNIDVLEGAITLAANQVPSLPSLQCARFYEKDRDPGERCCQGQLQFWVMYVSG